MFVHNFKYTLKYLFRNRMLVFWTYAFPIVMGLLFYLAFSDIENSEKLDIIDIAIVEEEAGKSEEIELYSDRQILLDTFESLSEEGSEEQLFHTEHITEKAAKEKLDAGNITGYILVDEEPPKVVVKESGINETILQYVVSEILQTAEMTAGLTEAQIQKQMQQDPAAVVDPYAIGEKVRQQIDQEEVSIRDISGENLSYTMIEYYTLIAMTCLYCATIGMYAVNCVLANMSKKGMRIGVSPIRKGRLILSSVCASYIVQLLGLGLLFLFTAGVLKVDYGTKVLPIILLALTGSLAGLTMGIAVGALVRTNENAKTGIIISITMLGCFLSGMMGITMKYVIDTNIPVLNRINPAGMITDGFYALYYYDTMGRYWFDIGSLLVFALLMLTVSFWALKRQKYRSL